MVTVVLTLTYGESSRPALASSRPLVLPIPSGQTWFVCQGYNGQVTHAGAPALDLSLVRDSAGRRGCLAGTKFSSAGSVVTSPAAGTAYRWPGCCGDDFVCVNFDSGGSAAIGHLSNRVASGTRVATGARIGTVAWPHASNGDYAHVHIQVHASSGCTEGSDPVAFDRAHGFKWACTPDLPYSGEPNQYSGLAVSRCGSPREGQNQRPGGEVDPTVRARDGGRGSTEAVSGESWLMRTAIRSVEVALSFAGRIRVATSYEELSDDDGAGHPGAIGQAVYSAVIRELSWLFERVTEPVAFPEAHI